MTRLLHLLFVFLLPYEMLWQLLFNSKTILKPYRICGALLVAFFALRLITGKVVLRLDKYDKTFLFIFAWSFMLVIFWSIVHGRVDYEMAIRSTLLEAFGLFSVVIIKCELKHVEEMDSLWWSFCLGTLSSSILAYFVGGPSESIRFTGIYENPNSLSFSAVACILFLAMHLLVNLGKNRIFTLFKLMSIAAFLYFLVQSGSRTALLALPPCLLIVLFFTPKNSLSSTKRSPLLLISLVFTVAFAGLFILNQTKKSNKALIRLEWKHSKSSSGRLGLWRNAWNVAQAHYFFGAGTDQYKTYHKEFIKKLDHVYDDRVAKLELTAHSEYLNMLVSGGALCLFLYLGLLFGIAKKALHNIKADLPPLASLYVPLPVLALIFISQIAAVLTQTPFYFLVLALVGLGTTACSSKNSSTQTSV